MKKGLITEAADRCLAVNASSSPASASASSIRRNRCSGRKVPFSEVNSPDHAALALKTARESMVLLKNEQHPASVPSKIKTIAVIGPNAAELSAIEGNYNAVPKNPVLPIDGIFKRFFLGQSPLRTGLALR